MASNYFTEQQELELSETLKEQNRIVNRAIKIASIEIAVEIVAVVLGFSMIKRAVNSSLLD